MNKEVVAPDIAAQEIEVWLDKKKVSSKKREESSESIETLQGAIVDGTISISEDNKIIHNLKFPIEGFAESLEYKPRLTVEEVKSRMVNVKPTDLEGRILATAAALTGKSASVLAKLDMEDNSIVRAVAVFFL